MTPDPSIKKLYAKSLAELINFAVGSGPSELEYTLLNIIAMFDATLMRFCDHSEVCNESIGSGKCNCGADVARQTYQEIEVMLDGIEH